MKQTITISKDNQSFVKKARIPNLEYFKSGYTVLWSNVHCIPEINPITDVRNEQLKKEDESTIVLRMCNGKLTFVLECNKALYSIASNPTRKTAIGYKSENQGKIDYSDDLDNCSKCEIAVCDDKGNPLKNFILLSDYNYIDRKSVV